MQLTLPNGAVVIVDVTDVVPVVLPVAVAVDVAVDDTLVVTLGVSVVLMLVEALALLVVVPLVDRLVDSEVVMLVDMLRLAVVVNEVESEVEMLVEPDVETLVDPLVVSEIVLDVVNEVDADAEFVVVREVLSVELALVVRLLDADDVWVDVALVVGQVPHMTGQSLSTSTAPPNCLVPQSERSSVQHLMGSSFPRHSPRVDVGVEVNVVTSDVDCVDMWVPVFVVSSVLVAVDVAVVDVTCVVDGELVAEAVTVVATVAVPVEAAVAVAVDTAVDDADAVCVVTCVPVPVLPTVAVAVDDCVVVGVVTRHVRKVPSRKAFIALLTAAAAATHAWSSLVVMTPGNSTFHTPLSMAPRVNAATTTPMWSASSSVPDTSCLSVFESHENVDACAWAPVGAQHTYTAHCVGNAVRGGSGANCASATILRARGAAQSARAFLAD